MRRLRNDRLRNLYYLHNIFVAVKLRTSHGQDMQPARRQGKNKK